MPPIPEPRQPDNGITKDQMAVQLPPNTVQEGEFQHTEWDAFIPNGLTPQNLLVPGFWAIHASRFKPFDEIRARAEDGTWLARYVVLEAGRTWARLQQLELHHLGTQDVSLTKAADQARDDARKGFEIKHRGPRGWSVVRSADSQMMHEGAASKPAAQAWLDEYLKRIETGAAVTA